MSTRPPMSQPVDHARWADERERRLREGAASEISGETTIKIPDPILDNRWAMILGGALMAVLAAFQGAIWSGMERMNLKIEAYQHQQADMRSEIATQAAAQSASTRVIDIRLNGIERAISEHGSRLERIERDRNGN